MAQPPITDVISQLPFNRSNADRWRQTRDLSRVDLVAVHYNGPAMDWKADPLALLAGDANFHIQKDWNPPYGVHGWALAYHYAIWHDGTIYATRPEGEITWNANSANTEDLAILCMIGEAQTPTTEMVQSLYALLDWLRTERPDLPNLSDVSQVHGHGELTQYGNATACPGPMLPYVKAYRAGAPVPVPGPVPGPNPDTGALYVPETRQYINHAFRDLYLRLDTAARNAGLGGLGITGYPLSGEYQEVVSLPDRGPTVITFQDFERVTMEYYPGIQARVSAAVRRLKYGH